jgi:hypothetical protein
MGLQTGTELAYTRSALINPYNLVVAAYEVGGPLIGNKLTFLRAADIRELSSAGFIVDSSDEFISLEDVVAINKIYNLGFQLINLAVIDNKKHRLGKVIDYTVEVGNLIIQQLNIQRPFLKSFGDTELLIHRSQIIEINNSHVVVRSGEQKPEPVRQVAKTYSNPFRNSTAPVENINTNN